MIQTLKSSERGYADHGWLKSFHSFSFADYHNPNRMGFSVLRVINEDFIEAGQGFPTHGHRDMEIVSYVVRGSLKHKDSMGNETIIKPGEVQRMSAGTGVRHSEYSIEKSNDTHLIQIWLLPRSLGISPSYGQKDFTESLSQKDLVLVASPDGDEGSVSIHQDARVWAHRKSSLDTEFSFSTTKSYWLQNIGEALRVVHKAEVFELAAGDALAVSQEEAVLKLSSQGNSEFLLFELPPM